MARANIQSVGEYIRSKPANQQRVLKQVRAAIRKALPGAEECLSYRMPTYRLGSLPVVYFAGWKDHFSVYPVTDALIAALGDEAAKYKISKGTLRFSYSEPVPKDLIERIAKFRGEQVTRPAMRSSGRKGKQESHLERVRRICAAMPSAFEKLSHGAPTFFVGKYKNVFAVFANDHPQVGPLAVWLPAPAGLQTALIDEAPETYFKPPYVGSSGWVGVNLDEINDEALEIHVRKAWELSSPKKKQRRHSTGSSRL
jgi:uncharacterized protein YdhG (YjbR/CyaY superfamily)